jgi:ATP-dependent DNA helicase RecG
VLVITEDHNIFGARHHYSLGKNGVIDTSDMSATDLAKRCRPHQLVIASTPVPRSFVESIYVDLVCSTLDELPSDRVLVTIEMARGSGVYIDKEFTDNAYKKVLEHVRLACEQGKQVYWVFNEFSYGSISPHSYLEARVSVKYDLSQLRVEFLRSIGTSSEDAATLRAFSLKELDVLGADSNICKEELNLPNADLIIIENAEDMRLIDLHQLRDLVSHGPEAGHCILLYGGEGTLDDIKKKRLQALCESNDGFYLAEQDLLLRGTREEWYGGCIQFKLANIEHDFALFPTVKHCAELLMTQYPTACEEIIQRWLSKSYVQL